MFAVTQYILRYRFVEDNPVLNSDNVIWKPVVIPKLCAYEVSDTQLVRNALTKELAKKYADKRVLGRGYYLLIDSDGCKRTFSGATLAKAAFAPAVGTWRTIAEFPQYEVSDLGQVRSIKTRVVCYASPSSKSPYNYVRFFVRGKTYNRSVHRLVALAFVSNPDGKRIVNHIDGDKLNNVSTNLEWVTMSENHKHAFSMGLKNREACRTQLNTKTKGASSQYTGVCFDRSREKWVGGLKLYGKMVMQKRFDIENAAAQHVNNIIDVLGLVDRRKNVIR